MASVKTISQKTGVSWFAVFMFALLLAFILYTASIGSLAKYKAFLFESGSGSSGSSDPSLQAQTSSVAAGTTANQTAANQNAGSSGTSVMSYLQTGAEIAGTIAMFA